MGSIFMSKMLEIAANMESIFISKMLEIVAKDE
jgi:hypothetical protein